MTHIDKIEARITSIAPDLNPKAVANLSFTVDKMLRYHEDKDLTYVWEMAREAFGALSMIESLGMIDTNTYGNLYGFVLDVYTDEEKALVPKTAA